MIFIVGIFCCDNSASTSADKIFRHWAVRQVQPIAENFAERKYLHYSDNKKRNNDNSASTSANKISPKSRLCRLLKSFMLLKWLYVTSF